jgi:hypothetical protein
LPVQGLDNCPQVQSLGHRLDSILALGTAVVVVCALEDEAKAFGYESDLGSFTPAEQEEGNLAETIILAHIVHGLSPPSQGAIETLLCTGFLGSLALTAGGLEALKAGVLDLTDGIIEIELSGKIPFAIVCVLTADVVGVQRQERLVGRHSGSSGVEKLHKEVEHVTHRVALKPEFLSQVEEDVFDFSEDGGVSDQEENSENWAKKGQNTHSFDSGIWRSEVHAGYGSRAPAAP